MVTESQQAHVKTEDQQADSQGMRGSNMETQKGRSEKSEFITCEKDASHGEGPAGEKSINPAMDKNDSLVHPQSEKSGEPYPHMMCAQNGRLVQAHATAKATKSHLTQIEAQSSQLASGTTINVVPPAKRPEYPRPQTKSMWGRLSQGLNRKEGDSRKEVDDDANQSERSASSFSLGPIMKDEGQESIFHPMVEATQPSPPKVLPPAGLPRGRYRNLVKARETSTAS